MLSSVSDKCIFYSMTLFIVKHPMFLFTYMAQFAETLIVLGSKYSVQYFVTMR